MKTWDECCEEAGYDRKAEPPTIAYAYYAYKQGAVYRCESRYDALKISSNIEKTCDKESKKKLNEFKLKQSTAESRAFGIWALSLKEEYSELPAAIFTECYNRAYDRAHSEGYDAVADAIGNYIEFAETIMQIMNNR